jgi:hypothetical protein
MNLKVNPRVVQIGRQVQYLSIALLFASFAVTANGADPEQGKEVGPNKWEIATRFEDNAQCAGGQVAVGGKLKVEFEVKTRDDGKKIVVPKTVEVNGDKLLPKDASNGVGATGPGRTYKVDRVELEFGNVGPGLRAGSMVMKIFFVAKPNAVNSAQGDLSPGRTFAFRGVYKRVEWSWNENNKVKDFFTSEKEEAAEYQSKYSSSRSAPKPNPDRFKLGTHKVHMWVTRNGEVHWGRVFSFAVISGTRSVDSHRPFIKSNVRIATASGWLQRLVRPWRRDERKLSSTTASPR